jgi:hypothetical protein
MSQHRLWGPILVLIAACDGGDVVLLAPDATAPAPSLSIRAAIDTPFATLAGSLGWTGGVPGARVLVHRVDEPYDSSHWQVIVADSSGLVALPSLGGLYEVEVTRPVTSADGYRPEAAVHVVAGGKRLYAPTNGTVLVTMAPDQRGSLIFSEFGFLDVDISGTEYPDGRYFEVYNNSDSTIYLDGKYWGIGWDLNRDYAYWPCAQTEVVRNDRGGIWAEVVFRFPGRGTDFPLLPGQPVVIAKSAIDHRAIDPRLPDLSHAGFEWGPPITADNPDVPNLQDVGPMPIVVNWPWPDQPEFLAQAVDMAALPRYIDAYSGHVWVRIPRAQILDASVGIIDFTYSSYVPQPPCLEDVHQAFERLPGPAFEPSDLDRGLTVQRRIVAILPDGRKLLQDTNTSMFDFMKAPRTPGWIPDSLP